MVREYTNKINLNFCIQNSPIEIKENNATFHSIHYYLTRSKSNLTQVSFAECLLFSSWNCNLNSHCFNTILNFIEGRTSVLKPRISENKVAVNLLHI